MIRQAVRVGTRPARPETGIKSSEQDTGGSMNFLTAEHTDVGIRKKTNQDSYLLQQAETDYGNVLLSVMCDGMGGLAKGEVASCRMIRACADWFAHEFPQILYSGMNPETLRQSWQQLAERENTHIKNYGIEIRADLGTTISAFLAVGETYYIMNVGDSRVYLISDDVYQLTKDQTFVQREMDLGRMTYEEAYNSPQRSVLLQCIGASESVVPDFYSGPLYAEQSYLLCCDGFRHVVGPEEFYQYLNPSACTDEQAMHERLVQLTELNKQRMETDNISAVLIRTY